MCEKALNEFMDGKIDIFAFSKSCTLEFGNATFHAVKGVPSPVTGLCAFPPPSEHYFSTEKDAHNPPVSTLCRVPIYSMC